MELTRSAGVLAHPTSFPSPYGIGDLGGGAYSFVDFLHMAKQSLWQILPLGPTGYGDSPYQSFSAFAGNHYLISPLRLQQQGYLSAEDLADIPDFDPRTADYGEMIPYKMGLYRKAFAAFQADVGDAKGAYTRFCAQNKDWLDNYALFVALKQYYIEERRNRLNTPAASASDDSEAERTAPGAGADGSEAERPVPGAGAGGSVSGGLKLTPPDTEYEAYRAANAAFLTEDQVNDYYYGAVWNSWPEPLARREPKALAEAVKQLHEEIAFNKFLQYEFFREWQELKTYANKKGLSVIGDIPIFVAMDSSDVWANPELFHLDETGRQTAVAGVPPDYFSETGQLWGNPLYDWDMHKKTDYAWWIRRIGAVLKLVDIARIDHFRGFESYWAVPYGEKTAVKGKWKKGPGKEVFKAIEKSLGTLPIIAEDLGIITEKVDKLRKGLRLPGMKILHFAFEPDGAGAYMPHNFTDDFTVLYTGTHDNDTSFGWYSAAPEAEKDYLRRCLNVSGEDIAWDLIRFAYGSSARYAVVPIQDVMGLGAEDRMNLPGQPTGCWKFRYTADMLKDEYAERLAYLAKLFNRAANVM